MMHPEQKEFLKFLIKEKKKTIKLLKEQLARCKNGTPKKYKLKGRKLQCQLDVFIFKTFIENPPD